MSLSKYEEFIKKIEKIDEFWQTYRKEVYEMLKEWIKLRIELLNLISKYVGILSRIEEEIIELTIKKEIGIISENEADYKIQELNDIKQKKEEELKKIKDIFEYIDYKASIHNIRAETPIGTISSSNEIEKRLEKLDEMRKQGEIDENLYNKLKDELEKLLSLIKKK